MHYNTPGHLASLVEEDKGMTHKGFAVQWAVRMAEANQIASENSRQASA